MKYVNQLLFSMILVMGSFMHTDAQNTPLATPATQNPDGSTNVPGTPAACAPGYNIYSIDHEDATVGFLPGGFCVTTELANSGTTPITVTGTPNGAGIGDVDNIVVDGGRVNYSSTDGGNLDATYNFCAPVTNPYVFIGDLETFTTINFFDCSGNPVNVNLMNGQNRFAVSGNSALITGTTSTNQDGYVQVPGTYSCLVININNPAPFTLDVIQIAVGVCMPDPPSATATCPYDLLMWKKGNHCQPVYRDANGVVWEKDQNNNNIASLGDELWTNTPICGSLVLLEEDIAIDDNACSPVFTCPADPYQIQFYEPGGTGCLYSTYWYDITNFPLNDPSPGNQWSAIFSGTDAFGLPAHPSTPTNAAENCGLEWLGDNEGDIDFDDEASGANEDEQLQMDGWLFVAPHLECIRFRVGSSSTDHSVGLYLGKDLNNMTLVAEENDEVAGGGNNSTGVTGAFCVPADAATTMDDCGWKVLRVRIYAHDDDTAYDPAIDWSFNGGLTWDVVEEQWFVAATSASDNTPPVTAPGGGPMTHCLLDSDDVLIDALGQVWPEGACAAAPTNLYEPNIPNGGTCFGDANAEEGDHFDLIPYCIVNAPPSDACNVCCDLSSSLAKTDEGCAGGNNGTITVTAMTTTCGGTLEYSLNGGMFQAGNVFSGLAPGAYTVDVRCSTDHSCTDTQMITVNPGTGTCPVISQTDENGDGNPEIVDPCSCSDPQNLVDGGTGQVTFFHDFFVVSNTGATGETWQITSGAGLFDNMGTPITPGTPAATLAEISPGVYRLDVWHQPGTGMSGVVIDRIAGGPFFTFPPQSNSCTACLQMAPVPTLGQWGLIFLALLLMTFGTLRVTAPKLAMPGGQTVRGSLTLKNLPFDKGRYLNILPIVALSVLAIFTVAITLFGYELTEADPYGSLVTIPLAAYLIMLLTKEDTSSKQ